MSRSATVGLIGDPVSHSISPAMQNAAFAALELDHHYAAWPTSAAQLRERVAGLRAPGMLGANVTLPHKLAVIPLLDQVAPEAAAIGAVNTIVRTSDGRLVGYNTDAPALVDSLRQDAGCDPAGGRVVLLGASGAARAACFALLRAGASQLTVVNRTLERAESVLADLIEATLPDAAGKPPLLDLGDELPALVALAADDPALAEAAADATLIINATSLGWQGEASPLKAAFIPPGTLVYDMVYRLTPLLRAAEARGARTCDGLGMLVRQGALAFERWTGKPAPMTVMWEAARGALAQG